MRKSTPWNDNALGDDPKRRLEQVEQKKPERVFYRAARSALLPLVFLGALDLFVPGQLGTGQWWTDWGIYCLFAGVALVLTASAFKTFQKRWAYLSGIKIEFGFNVFTAIMAIVCIIARTLPNHQHVLAKDDAGIIGNFIEWFGIPYGLLMALVLVNVWLQHQETEKDLDDEADEVSVLFKTIREIETLDLPNHSPELYNSATSNIMKYARHVRWFHQAEHRKKPPEDALKYTDIADNEYVLVFDYNRSQDRTLQVYFTDQASQSGPGRVIRKWNRETKGEWRLARFKRETVDLAVVFNGKVEHHETKVKEVRVALHESGNVFVLIHHRDDSGIETHRVLIAPDALSISSALTRESAKQRGDRLLNNVHESLIKLVKSTKHHESLALESLREYRRLADIRGDRITHSEQRVPPAMTSLMLISSLIWIMPFWILLAATPSNWAFELRKNHPAVFAAPEHPTEELDTTPNKESGPDPMPANNWCLLAGMACFATFTSRAILELVHGLDDPYLDGPFRIEMEAWDEVVDELSQPKKSTS